MGFMFVPLLLKESTESFRTQIQANVTLYKIMPSGTPRQTNVTLNYTTPCLPGTHDRAKNIPHQRLSNRPFRASQSKQWVFTSEPIPVGLPN